MQKSRKKIVYVQSPPDGLFYIPNFITLDEERELLHHAQGQPFEPYDHHGYKANREVVYYGLPGGYDADVGGELPGAEREPMPEWLLPLRAKFAHLAGLSPDEIAMVLVAQYKPGAGIGWHRDRPQFGPTVFGVSLHSDAEMRFRRYVGDIEEMYKINLQHRSAYMISGPARSVWQHGMNPVKALRYSITMRTVKDIRKGAPVDPRHLPANIQSRLKDMNFYHLGGAAPPMVAEKRPEDDEPKQLKFAL